MYVAVAVVAALAFACSGVLKHRSARLIAAEPTSGRGRLRTLVVHSVRHKLWLLAIAVDILAIALQVLALHAGPLSVVQPLLGVSLIFALAITARGRLPFSVWLWCAVLIGSVAAVSRLVTSPLQTTVHLVAAVVVAGVVLTVACSCIVLASRAGASRGRAMVLGGGVGVLYAVNAALLKSIAAITTTHGLVGVVSSWQLYAVIVGGATGLLINQAAFQAGSLQQALPAMAAADPLTSIVIGVTVFGEPLAGGSLGIVALTSTVGLLVAASMRLAATAVAPDESAGRARAETFPAAKLTSCAS